MAAVIEFIVFDTPITAYGCLAEGWGKGQTFLSSFSLVANPPPDTLLMCATGADFSVFGEEIPLGGLQIVNHEDLTDLGYRDKLAGFRGDEAESTATTLAAYAKAHGHLTSVTSLKQTLRTGVWPTSADAMAQAAAFAFHFGVTADLVNVGQSVGWAYRNTVLRYDY